MQCHLAYCRGRNVRQTSAVPLCSRQKQTHINHSQCRLFSLSSSWWVAERPRAHARTFCSTCMSLCLCVCVCLIRYFIHFVSGLGAVHPLRLALIAREQQDDTRKKSTSTYLVENSDIPPPLYQKDGTLPVHFPMSSGGGSNAVNAGNMCGCGGRAYRVGRIV